MVSMAPGSVMNERRAIVDINVERAWLMHMHAHHHIMVQVSAHGTGAAIPPVDEQVVAMKLVTPAKGTIHLSLEEDEETFRMARVGLGLLGAATELTLQCVPAHELVEKTWTATPKELQANHAK